MWHEARKQEKKIRGMLVDYRKRAERRQDFYEKIKADPTQFMQIHGRNCKIHLDPAVAAAGDSPAIMMPWHNQADNMIDRFDARAHLDFIPPIQRTCEELDTLSSEERQCNYERYRILAQNDFVGISEEKYLHQLYLEEQFGVNAQPNVESEKSKKNKPSVGVAIGYNYEDSTAPALSNTLLQTAQPSVDEAAEEESDSDIDVDVAIDITKLDTAQAHELNTFGRNYGMTSNDFYSFLTKDADEADALRMAREEEQEKIMLSGRKSRRERRAQRERRFIGRPISPPSYAAKEESPDALKKEMDDDERSDSHSPVNSGKITYITSFGGEDELQAHANISFGFNKNSNNSKTSHFSSSTATYADKVKENLSKLKELNHKRDLEVGSRKGHSRRSRSRSRSRDRYGRCYGRGRRNNRSNSRSVSRTRSISRNNRRSSYTRHRSRSSHRLRSKRRYSSSSSRSSSSSKSPRRSRRRYTSSSSSSSSSSRTKPNKTTIKSPIVPSNPPSIKPFSQFSTQRAVDLPSPSSLEQSFLSQPPPKPPIAVEQFPSALKASEPPMQMPSLELLPQPPIKKYYGRKRDDQSSSSEASSSDAENGNKDSAADEKMTKTSATNSNEDEPMDTSTSDRSMSGPASSSKFGKSSSTASNVLSKESSSYSTSMQKAHGLNPRDRLKRKMQILLNKQYKADKMAEIEKTERQIQQQMERDTEMHQLALQLRRRQREMRHRYGSPTSSQSSDNDNVSSSGRRSQKNASSSRSRSSSYEKVVRRRSRSPRRRVSRSRSASRRRSRSRSRSRSRRTRSPRRRGDDSRRKRSVSRRRSSSRWDGGPSNRRSKSRSRNAPKRYDRERGRDRSGARSSRKLVDY